MDKEGVPANNLSVKSTPPPTPTDDESITTSTESEIFETWTLVTDKNNKEKAKHSKQSKNDDHNNRVETIMHDNDREEEEDEEEEEKGEPNDSKTEHDSIAADDLSDGISIISESESAGRISPHPYLRDHLNNLNLQHMKGDEFIVTTPPPISTPLLMTPHQTDPESGGEIDNSQMRQRRRKRSSSANSEKKALQAATTNTTTATTMTTTTFMDISRFHPIVRHSLTGIFYVGVILSILAVIGKIRHASWDPLAATKSTVDLEQKLIDIELQNNLMRAEIDILSKQVDYLSTRRETGGSGNDDGVVEGRTDKNWATYKKRQTPIWEAEHKKKPYKVWTANPHDTTKGEHRQPYVCPNAENAAAEGMCVAPTEKEMSENSLNEFDNAAGGGDVVQESSESFETFAKVAQYLNDFNDNIFEQKDEELPQVKPETTTSGDERKQVKEEEQLKVDSNSFRNEHAYKNDYKYVDDSKERIKQQQKKHFAKEHHYLKHDHDDDDDDDSNERFKKRNKYNNSKERFGQKHPHPSQNNKQRFDSRERHDKQWRKHEASGERFAKDGQWQEKLMQHREQSRQQNERQRNEKNWYMERADSREQLRHR